MQGQGSELRYDFPVVSDDQRFASDRNLVNASPGDRVVSVETLYQAGPGRFDKGPVVGKLTLAQDVSLDNDKVVTATFDFDDGDTVTFQGKAPGNGSWNGKGAFGYSSGTGKFEFPRKNLPVDSENPKRWG